MGSASFNQKLQLVQIVIKQREPGPNSPNSDLCLAIDKLNQIRNQLAHNLKKQEEIEKDVKDFIGEYRLRGDKKLGLGQTAAEQLKGCLHKLCWFLCNARVHFFKLKLPSDE
jgi:hypothetical protein